MPIIIIPVGLIIILFLLAGAAIKVAIETVINIITEYWQIPLIVIVAFFLGRLIFYFLWQKPKAKAREKSLKERDEKSLKERDEKRNKIEFEIKKIYNNWQSSSNTTIILDTNIWMGNSRWHTFFFSVISSLQGEITLLRSQINELENIQSEKSAKRALGRISTLQQEKKIYMPPPHHLSDDTASDFLQLMEQLLQSKMNIIIITDHKVSEVRFRALNTPLTLAHVDVYTPKDLFSEEYNWIA